MKNDHDGLSKDFLVFLQIIINGLLSYSLDSFRLKFSLKFIRISNFNHRHYQFQTLLISSFYFNIYLPIRLHLMGIALMN